MFGMCVPAAAKAWMVAIASYATGKVHLARECQQGNGQGVPVRGSRRPQPPVSLHCSVVTVATTKSKKAATVWGKLGGVKAEVMLDSGSLVSLKVMTASGAELPVVGHIKSSIHK